MTSRILAVFAISVPVPLWFALTMVVLMLAMNYFVREQLRLVRWFYDNRPRPDEELPTCNHGYVGGCGICDAPRGSSGATIHVGALPCSSAFTSASSPEDTKT